MFEIRNLTHTYGQGTVLAGLDLTIKPGDKVAIIGESGTGKSTLARILTGILTPDDGHITIAGSRWSPGGTGAALSAGIGVLHQHSAIMPSLSVAENLMIGRVSPRGRFGALVDRAAVNEQAANELAGTALAGFVSRNADELSDVDRRRLEIARLLRICTTLMVLDEPTDLLEPAAGDTLFAELCQRISSTDTVLYLGHRLDQAHALGARILVLAEGKLTESAGDVRADIRAGARPDPTALESLPVATSQASAPDTCFVGTDMRSAHICDGVLTIRPGEIVGACGPWAAELASIIYGAPGTSGTMTVRDRALPNRPGAAVKALVGYVDSSGSQSPLPPPGLFGAIRARLGNAGTAVVDPPNGLAAMDRFVFRLRSLDPTRRTTCTGLWRRTVMRRWLLLPPTLLICQDPWYGLDLTSADVVSTAIRELAAAGMGLLLIDRNLAELTQCCDRLLTVRDGQLVSLAGGQLSTSQ